MGGSEMPEGLRACAAVPGDSEVSGSRVMVRGERALATSTALTGTGAADGEAAPRVPNDGVMSVGSIGEPGLRGDVLGDSDKSVITGAGSGRGCGGEAIEIDSEPSVGEETAVGGDGCDGERFAMIRAGSKGSSTGTPARVRAGDSRFSGNIIGVFCDDWP